MSAAPTLLRVDHLSKTFDGVRVVTDFSLEIGAGEVCGFVGPNGCGKSTVVKMLSGFHRPDPGGRIELGGGREPVQLAFVHQDLGLVGDLSVLENVALQRGYATAPGGRIRWREQRRRTEALISDFAISARPDTPVAELSAADEALLAMARALSTVREGRPAVLVLDEPTSSLADEEVKRLLAAVRGLVRRGSSVIFVSHRLDEVLEVSDRVCVMRDGRNAATRATSTLDHAGLMELMLGRQLERRAAAATAPRGEAEVPLVSLRGIDGRRLRGVSLRVYRGEVLGVTGLLGSGKSELGRILAGAQALSAGSYELDGAALRLRGPRDAIKRGVAYVPQERHTEGSIGELTARENLTLPDLGRFWHGGRVVKSSERRETADWMRRVGVRPPLPERALSTFSGGNQQKLVFAKWFRMQPRLLVLDEPTKAVDVGAAQDIYDLVLGAAERGVAVVLLSSEWDDLPGLCRRIVVLDRGAVVAELEADLSADGIADACHAGAAGSNPTEEA